MHLARTIRSMSPEYQADGRRDGGIEFSFLASLVTPATLFFVCATLGLCLGLCWSYGPHMLLGLPIAAAFYLTLGARVSKRFARALFVSTFEGQTSFTEAFRMLGLKKMATFRELGHRLGVGF